MRVCVCDSVACVTESRPISGRFSAAPNSQTLWSGRPRWQSWHLSLSGWERVVCEWPGAGWDALNHLHHVSVGSHAWVCTSGCSRVCVSVSVHERSSANVYTVYCASVLCIQRAENVDARVCASKCPNPYLICNLFISRVLCSDPMAMYWNENDLIWLWTAVL